MILVKFHSTHFTTEKRRQLKPLEASVGAPKHVEQEPESIHIEILQDFFLKTKQKLRKWVLSEIGTYVVIITTDLYSKMNQQKLQTLLVAKREKSDDEKFTVTSSTVEKRNTCENKFLRQIILQYTVHCIQVDKMDRIMLKMYAVSRKFFPHLSLLAITRDNRNPIFGWIKVRFHQW